jgi:hypothetical protein
VETRQDIMSDLIPFVLQSLHALGVLGQSIEFIHSLDQQLRRYDQVI